MNEPQCMMYRFAFIALLAIMIQVPIAVAADSGTPMFSFSGFGTLGMTHSSEHNADFTPSLFKPDGAGYTSAWSHDVDSLIAAQVTAEFTDKLVGVAQVISEQYADGKYTPEFEWANLKYDFTPDFSIRVGRTILPTFLASGYRKVGYANPWVRPPYEVYRLVPVSSNDGIDVMYRSHSDKATNTLHLVYGGKRTKNVDGGTSRAKNNWDLVETFEYNAFTFHAGYHQVEVSVFPDNPQIKTYTLGASYDPGQWFLMGEIAFNRAIPLGDSDGWYVTGGYRIKNFTPYITYARLESRTDPLFFPPAEQQNTSVGIRWDFYQGMDIKLQYERINLDAGSTGLFINTQPGFQPGSTVNLFNVAVDFVF